MKNKARKPSNPMIAIQNAQLLAIEGRLISTPDAFERRVRRWFSKEFSTAYLDTFKIPWDELLLHFYESNLADKSYNEVFDLAVEQYLPEFMEKTDEDDQAFADSLIKAQKAAIRAKKAKEALDKAQEKKARPEADKEAKTGSESQSVTKDTPKQADMPLPKTMSLKFDDEDGPEDL